MGRKVKGIQTQCREARQQVQAILHRFAPIVYARQNMGMHIHLQPFEGIVTVFVEDIEHVLLQVTK